LNGYVCLLGVDQDRNTTLHSVEALLELPYLREVSGEIEVEGRKIEKTWRYYPGPHRNFIGLDRLLRRHGKMRVRRVGQAVALLVKSRDLIDLLLQEGQENPAFCLCDNPSCADCVAQRSALRQNRLSRENFRVSIAAAAAGRYVPEIIEHLQAAGCHLVELDTIQGQPVFLMPAAKLTATVAEFAAAKIQVSALRLPAVPAELPPILERAAAAGIKRLIMPLSERAPAQVGAGKSCGIEIDFVNVGISGAYAESILSRLGRPALVFSPAGFAKAGEKPFLETFHGGKLRRRIVQLELEDGKFDGTITDWGQGNAELKELVSILRCGSFQGTMNVAAGNRELTTAAAATPWTRKLIGLLEDIGGI
ncbi:MAG: AAC(3) family N-acetyltransferase, partial [Victivallales bacterium]|nr:AAC(3) family N-acetyltransferase [Victivallales bacterium]